MPSKANHKESFQQINQIYLALLGGQLVFCLTVVLLISNKGGSTDAVVENIFYLIPPIAVIGTALGAFAMRNHYRKEARGFIDRDRQFDHYRTGFVFRMALLEAASLLNVILMMVTGQIFFFLIFFFVGLASFWLLRPQEEELVEWYP
ncbi:MAG: hypothetical protein AAF990_09615 [Bacteroidota bacterium]